MINWHIVVRDSGRSISRFWKCDAPNLRRMLKKHTTSSVVEALAWMLQLQKLASTPTPGFQCL